MTTRPAGSGAATAARRGGRHEPADDADADVDAQFRSLLEGLRTTLPGVQVLFAFLLTAPLSSRFEEFGSHERTAFSVAFYAAGISSILLIAPGVHQRVRAPISGIRRHSKQHLIWTTWVAIIGSLTMGAAMIATAFLVSRLIYDSSRSVVATALVAATMIWSWFYLPLVTFNRMKRRER